MLLPSGHMAMLLGIGGLVLLLVTVRPDEHRGVRLVLCLAMATAVLLYLDWQTGLLFLASPDQIHGAVWVWCFYIFELIAFGEIFVLLWQVSWLTDRTDVAGLILFVLVGTIISALSESLHRTQRRTVAQASLLDLTHDSISVRDMNDVITYWNRGAEELYGWTREEAVGNVSHQLMQTTFPTPLEEIKAELLWTGRWEGELIHTRRDGIQVIVASRWALQRDESGNPVAVLETNNDITERKRAEEELRRREAYLAEAQRLSHTGSFGWNVSSGAIYWSEETFRIFAYDRANKPTVELVLQRTHPEDIALIQQFIDRAPQERKDCDFEHRLLMPDGSAKYVQVVAHPLQKDESGNLEFVGAVMDITERKRAEEALHKAQAESAHLTRVMALGELVASIAPEVNQPLTAVVTNGNACLRWLARDPLNLEEAREAVRRMIRDGNRAGEVIARIRALVRKAEPQKAQLAVNDVIAEVIALVQSELRRHGVALHTDLAADLPPVLADRIQLQQVLLNLLLNGVEAMRGVTDRPRALIVRSQPEEAAAIRVGVQDAGTGIDPQDLERIFTAFFTTKPEGLGMGLAISRTLIEAHGGRL